MPARAISFTALFLLIVSATAWASAEYWEGEAYVGTDTGGGIGFGARPGWQDGHDGQSPIDLVGYSGIQFANYRTWGGSPGFYQTDMESPISAGGSKTWSDIYLWSQNYTPHLGNHDRVGISVGTERSAPTGWWGRLFLDYVPAPLDWTGPWHLDFPLDGGSTGLLLPVPITDNPYDPTQVTRMHLTVYTTPIPEPSSLLALAGGLGGMGLLRRRVRSKQ